MLSKLPLRFEVGDAESLLDHFLKFFWHEGFSEEPLLVGELRISAHEDVGQVVSKQHDEGVDQDRTIAVRKVSVHDDHIVSWVAAVGLKKSLGFIARCETLNVHVGKDTVERSPHGFDQVGIVAYDEDE